MFVVSGKISLALAAAGAVRLGDEGGCVSIVRLEQRYPWPDEGLSRALARHAAAGRFYWVQEEPANMGRWSFVRERLPALLPAGAELRYAGRTPAASTAAGSLRVHRAEQAALVETAFEGL